MRRTLIALLGTLPALGCSGTSEVLIVEGALPGTCWEIVSFEGPLRVEGEVRPMTGGGTFGFDAEVLVVEMERRGWGTLMPWSWFGHDRALQYSLTFSVDPGTPAGQRGARAVSFWTRPPGVLTDPGLTYRQLIAENGDGDDDWAMPVCDARQAMEAREYLSRRILAAGRPSGGGT